jgi:hypothetical protein
MSRVIHIKHVRSQYGFAELCLASFDINRVAQIAFPVYTIMTPMADEWKSSLISTYLVL